MIVCDGVIQPGTVSEPDKVTVSNNNNMVTLLPGGYEAEENPEDEADHAESQERDVPDNSVHRVGSLARQHQAAHTLSPLLQTPAVGLDDDLGVSVNITVGGGREGGGVKGNKCNVNMSECCYVI